MKLRSLQLHGFKSFADRTELTFHDGITAVVGPNGCGKSNISDAIRWVLGEQRASAIRGSKMEEAIFQGTAARRPVNRAEVALTFSNEDQRLAVPFEEIQIRRTIFREGGSEYELNRAPCRLRDILDLCRDTGLGAMAYAVIEQRMVDGILSDRTDDRRHIFEEAAGIGRYKDRRRAAERRLDAARGDLERLEDLISEVESKVRSLSRQRRQAQRYQEMRDKRLALEVTLAALEIEAVDAERVEIVARLAELVQDQPSARATLARVEVDLEQHRLEAAEAMRVRGTVAAQIESVAQQIAERDREIAVIDERRAHAERRLTQIGIERSDLISRDETLVRDIASLESSHAAEREQLEVLTARLEEVQILQQMLRQQVVAARAEDEEARRVETEFGRRAAELETIATRGDAREAEGIARIERARVEEEELRVELASLNEQGDLFADLARNLASSRMDRHAEYEAAVQRLAALRAREAEARRSYTEAEDRAARISAQVSAIEALEREHHGLAPRTAAALKARERLVGVLGPLAEFLDLSPQRAAEVENALGSLLQLLVVEDQAAAERVRAWLREETPPGEGTLAILAREVLPDLEKILASIIIAGDAPAEAILIGRRERLERLRADADAARAELEARAEVRSAAEGEAELADAAVREREAAVQSVELELGRAEAESVNSAGQRGRLERALEELQRQQITLLEAVEVARGEAEAARAARRELDDEAAARQEAWQIGHAELARLEASWETAREEEAELRVVHARGEAAVAEAGRRCAGARRRQEEGRERVAVLGREEVEHRQSLTQLREVRTQAEARIEELFRRRDSLTAELHGLDERLASATAAATSLESELRTQRRAAEGQVEERHRLELRRGELEAALRSVRERIEVEWGRPFSQLLSAAERLPGEAPALRAELHALIADLERLGPINMLAIEEHEEESTRLAFLTTQRDDLIGARDDLQDAIRQINRRARELFTETFEQVRTNFHRTFGTLFDGGSCDLTLTDPEDPLESDIEVSASPRGKRTQRIHLLSGGERALTALSLLFAIYLVKPSPFCVLDEVDAPLDESNVGRFVAMIQEFKKDTQFIIITHNPRTIEAADWVYGVTMEEPGVSTMVGVQLDPALTGGATR
jgi:chromosome segregation protein